MNKPDNPPAFPMTGMTQQNGQTFQAVFHHGMTLRDWFAGQAPGIPNYFPKKPGHYKKQPVSVRSDWTEMRDVWHEAETELEWLCRWRYAYADAMLSARSASPAKEGT